MRTNHFAERNISVKIRSVFFACCILKSVSKVFGIVLQLVLCK